MADFTPSFPYITPMRLLIPEVTVVKGVSKKIYPAISNGIPFNASFKTFGGTESVNNGVYSVEDTATVETWYRPEIKSNCRVALVNHEGVYEIMGEPENINMRNQFLKFKVRRVKGGA